ncbi:MAG: metallophosphoesterase [Flavobacteriales bacterium]|nr:metallophosphoesterase [Flavobacteriales bacterium]
MRKFASFRNFTIGFTFNFWFFQILPAQSIVRGPYLQCPNPHGITIMWRTDVATDSKVWFGTSPVNLSYEIEIAGTRTDHAVTLNGLQPGTTYYYAVGTNQTQLTTPSTQYRFKTAPLPGTQNPIRIWAIGDFGKGNADQINVKNAYMQYPGSSQTDVWLWLGDNVYDEGKDQEYQDKVFGLEGFRDVFSWLPFWAVPGNHDYIEVWRVSSFLGIPYSNIPYTNHQGPYYDIIHAPTNGEAGGVPSGTEAFYSFEYGNVHFIMLNSEIFDFTLTYQNFNQMIDWLKQDLAQNQATFTIVVVHQAPYSKGSHDSDSPIELIMRAVRERILPVLEQYDVDVVLCGHSHVYERTFLMHGHYGPSSTFNFATMVKNPTNGRLAWGQPYKKDDRPETPDGTVYIVCGNSGSKTTEPELNYPAMVFSDGGPQGVGSLVIDVYRNRMDIKYLRASGQIWDDFTILKKNLKVPDNPRYILLCEPTPVTLDAHYAGGSDQVSVQWSHTSSTSLETVVYPTENAVYTATLTDALTGQTLQVEFNVVLANQWNPPIFLLQDTLWTLPGFTYQWFKNGQPILGATEAWFFPSEDGSYSVQITQNGCTAESLPFQYNISLKPNQEEDLRVFPNPTTGLLHIHCPHTCSGESFRILNALGQVIHSGRLQAPHINIPLFGLANGLYFLQSGSRNIRFQVQH